MKILALTPLDAAGPGSTKRAVPEATPGREAATRSIMLSTKTIVPKVL